MKDALDQATTPMDCRMEAVMPAVHHRLDANHKVTVDVGRDLGRRIHDLERTIEGGFSCQRELLKDEIEQSIGSLFQNIGRAFQGGIAVPMDVDNVQRAQGIGEEPTSPVQEQDQGPSNADINDRPPIITLRPIYGNLMDLYDHWNALGVYKQQDGWSIAELEQKYRWKWRKEWSPADKLRFSRVQRIMEAIIKEARNRNPNDPDFNWVVLQWSETLESMGKFSINKTMNWLISHGKIQTKKSRGKAAGK
jgi:hypothetical protein